MTDPAPLAPELERWIAAFRGPLIGYLASRGASFREAEELAMDTFAEAWVGRDRRRAPIDDLDAIGGWLRGIANNLLLAFRRRRLRANTAFEDEPAARQVEPDERHDALRAAFAKLPPEMQEILRMHYLESTSAAEVAALLGVTRKAVEGRLYQARRSLREHAERALRAGANHRRPDAAAFAHGIASRLKDRSSGNDEAAAPVRRAAGQLPLDAAVLGAAKGTLASWPMWLLSLVGAAFVGAFQALRTTLSDRPAAQTPLGRAWSERSYVMVGSFLTAGIVVAALTGMSIWWLADALLLVLTASMVLLVLGVRRHAAGHGVDRTAVAMIALGALEAVAILALFWLHEDSVFAGGARWQTGTLVVLSAGILALVPLTKHAAFGALLTLAIVLVPSFLLRVARPMTVDDLVEFVAASTPASPAPTLLTLADAVAELQQSGRAVTLPTAIDEALVAARDDDPPNAFALSAEARLDRIDDATWRRLAERPVHAFALDRLLRETSPLQPYAFQDYEAAMLVAVRDLDDAAKDRLAERLVAGLADAPMPLEAWAVAMRWLDRIGRPEALTARKGELDRLLVRHQFLGQATPGGFSATLDVPHSNLGATSAAVALMGRFGAPAGVDLHTLHDHLRRTARLLAWDPETGRQHAAGPFVDLRRFERSIGEPARSLPRLLVDERNFVAMTALVLLCIYAAWASPRPMPPLAGALP
ncbi:MAG: sigma-70 family RNA polymerase sigma factor [Planctomycetes bacterium]|nr:sigma-70 family RNA polymerase sigma factor [Planctomycetota bacterium]